MSAASIIKRVRDAGGEIKLAEDRIRLRVPASLQDVLAAEVRAQKNAIRLRTQRPKPAILGMPTTTAVSTTNAPASPSSTGV